ncbi:MAG: hypothetical protein JWM91_1263 [Rhodospirillales bacterium]|nr:hypothetical protein [Rhodospirillales bacterium]
MTLLETTLTQSNEFDFLAGGGEMGARIRAYDWRGSVLGPPEGWPESLKVTLQLLLNAQQPMLIWWGPQLIQFYNDSYIPMMEARRHPSALGGRARDFCADIWDVVGPQVEYVMAGKGATSEENRLAPVIRRGQPVNAWWSYSFEPIEGGVGGVFVLCSEVTSQHLSHESLEGQTRQLTQLFEQAPGYMAVLRGPDQVFEFTNSAFVNLIGGRDFIGKPLREIIPEIVPQGALELLEEAYNARKARVGTRAPLKVRPLAGGPLKEIFVDFVFQPIVEANGAISGIFVAGVDVTDHVHAEQHLQLINAELEHRVKNTLAVVSGIASQTFRGAVSDTVLDTFMSRLGALGKAHKLLTAKSHAAIPTRDVVEQALTPHRMGHRRISVSGPEIVIGSKQALSLGLAVHELATNAIKYGALSNDRGRIAISWWEKIDDGVAVFHFLWRESGGPPVVLPSIKGFGSQLIEGQLAWAFEGHVEVRYMPSGLICRLTAPVAKLELPLPASVPRCQGGTR